MEITKIYESLPATVQSKAVELANQVKASSNNSKVMAKSIYDLVNDPAFKEMKSAKNPKKPMGIAEFADKYFQGYLTGAMAHKYYTAYAVLAMHDAVMWDALPIGKLCIASQIRSKKMIDGGASSIGFYVYYLSTVNVAVKHEWKEYNAKIAEIEEGIDSTNSNEVKSILENQLAQIVKPTYPENYLDGVPECVDDIDANGTYPFEVIREIALADFAIMNDKAFSEWVKAYKEFVFPEPEKSADGESDESGRNSSENEEPETPETWAKEALQNLEKYVNAEPGCSPKIKSAIAELRKLCGAESCD